MKPLTQYGLMVQKHWRDCFPRTTAELERQGRLGELVLEAEEKTYDEVARTRRELMARGLTPQQAHDRACKLVREDYISLPPGM